MTKGGEGILRLRGRFLEKSNFCELMVINVFNSELV
jgi:hypothetical protein